MGSAIRWCVAAVLAGSGVAAPLLAADRATPAEAKAMLDKAVAHYKSVGRAKALADFSAKSSPFHDRELYVVCIGKDATITANGAFPAFVGVSADSLKDANGKPLGGAIVAAGSAPGGGSIRYPMINPVNRKSEPKTMFAQKVGEDVCGVGVYGP